MASIAGRLQSLVVGLDLGWLRSRGGFDHGAASIWGGFSVWIWAAERVRAEKESREREQKKSREGEQRGESRTRVLGQWFTENFSVNRFPFFPSPFYGQIQTFSV